MDHTDEKPVHGIDELEHVARAPGPTVFPVTHCYSYGNIGLGIWRHWAFEAFSTEEDPKGSQPGGFTYPTGAHSWHQTIWCAEARKKCAGTNVAFLFEVADVEE